MNLVKDPDNVNNGYNTLYLQAKDSERIYQFKAATEVSIQRDVVSFVYENRAAAGRGLCVVRPDHDIDPCTHGERILN